MPKKSSVDKRQSKEIRKLNKKVKSLMAPIERKYHDVAFSQAVAGNSQTYVLNGVEAQTYNTPPAQSGSVVANTFLQSRLGKKITMNRIMIKGTIRIQPDFSQPTPSTPPYNTDTYGKVRLLVVRWPTNDNAANSLPSDFLQDPPYPAAPVIANQDKSITAFKKRNPLDKYEVLYDKLYNLQSYCQRVPLGAPAANAAPVYPFIRDVNIDLKLKHNAEWAVAENTNPSTPNRNAICMYIIAGNSGMSPAQSNTRYIPLLNCRLHYTDL
ncbi:MAG: hypothetical protein [Geminiviridae sp.]|nr:MAG: hypothetical protein [Geminiviridae sp.]